MQVFHGNFVTDAADPAAEGQVRECSVLSRPDPHPSLNPPSVTPWPMMIIVQYLLLSSWPSGPQ